MDAFSQILPMKQNHLHPLNTQFAYAHQIILDLFSLNKFFGLNSLKIPQNVAFLIWPFPPIFVLLKMTCLVTLFDRQLQVFKNPFLALLMNSFPLTRNVE